MGTWWVNIELFYILEKQDKALGTFQVLLFKPLEKKVRKTFTGNFARSAHVFKLGVFSDTFRE